MTTSTLQPAQFDPQRGRDFARLTYQGKAYYIDRRYSEGASHDEALADARYSYGTIPARFTRRTR